MCLSYLAWYYCVFVLPCLILLFLIVRSHVLLHVFRKCTGHFQNVSRHHIDWWRNNPPLRPRRRRRTWSPTKYKLPLGLSLASVCRVVSQLPEIKQYEVYRNLTPCLRKDKWHCHLTVFRTSMRCRRGINIEVAKSLRACGLLLVGDITGLLRQTSEVRVVLYSPCIGGRWISIDIDIGICRYVTFKIAQSVPRSRHSIIKTSQCCIGK